MRATRYDEERLTKLAQEWPRLLFRWDQELREHVAYVRAERKTLEGREPWYAQSVLDQDAATDVVRCGQLMADLEQWERGQ